MTEIILAAIALVAAPLSAWLTSRMEKSKYAQEVEKLKTEVEQMKSDVRARELDNDRKSIEMVMELVVEPIRKEMKSLQRKVDRLTNAIDKIPSCPHSANCPVSRELQHEQKLDQSDQDNGPAKGPSRRGRKAGAEPAFYADGHPGLESHGDPADKPD